MLTCVVPAAPTVKFEPAGNQQLLKLAMRLGQFVSWRYDPESGLDFLVRKLGRLHGLIPNGLASDVGGLKIHPADAARVARIFKALPNWNRSVEFEMRLVFENGNERWFSVCAARACENSYLDVLGLSCDVTDRKRAFRALRERTTLIRTAALAGGLGQFELDVPSFTLSASTSCRAIFGRSPSDVFTFADFLECICARDHPRLKKAVEAAIKSHGTLDIDFRLAGQEKRRHQIRLLASIVNHERPRLLGICVDATNADHISPEQMLRRELNHRLRNVFPLILTIVKQTANNHPEAAAYRDGLERRLRALAAATKLIDRDETEIVYIEDLIRLELAAFEDGHNIVIGGPLVEIPRGILQDFAILVHELTTNAVKHGALSYLRGSLSVTWALPLDHSGKPSLQFDWIERNGPKVGPVKTPGFGSLVIRESGSILGGTASMNYAPEGFQYRLTLAAERPTAEPEF